jgi:hypothetical protein
MQICFLFPCLFCHFFFEHFFFPCRSL